MVAHRLAARIGVTHTAASSAMKMAARGSFAVEPKPCGCTYPTLDQAIVDSERKARQSDDQQDLVRSA
jgi:hypothetical protein